MKIKTFLLSLFIFIFLAAPFYCLAEETTNISCNHNFELVGFNTETGLATIKCSLCDYSYTDYFVNHLSSDINANQNDNNYEPLFDVVNDGVINNKDYVYLMQLYSNDFSIEGFSNKEKFYIIYSTVILLVFTFIIVFSVRRRTL